MMISNILLIMMTIFILNIQIELYFKGWKIMEKEIEDKSFRMYLDMLYKQKNLINLIGLVANEKLEKNILHLNEASLVQKLEKLNIGRPSTYSSIIQSLLDKKYVEKCTIEGKEVVVKNYVIKKDKTIQEN